MRRAAWGWCLAWGLAATAGAQPSPRLEALAAQAGLSASAASESARMELEAELAMRDILGEKAKALGLDKDPKVAAAMELAALSALGQAYLERERSAPDAQALEADWRSAYPPKPLARVKVALFKELPKAREALARLRGGKQTMESVAAGADDGLLAARGGDLGWIPLDALPPELAKALGEPRAERWPKEPTRTAYGFALYEFDGLRTAPEKTLEQAMPELASRRQDLDRRVELAKLRIQAQSRIAPAK